MDRRPRAFASTVSALALCACVNSAQDTWHSRFFPPDWTPESTAPDGTFLHDFSYAGYRLGNVPLPKVMRPVIAVTAADGLDPTGERDSAAAIQKALSAAGERGGAVVQLPAGLFRCDSRLGITASNVVLRGGGPEVTRLYFPFAPERSSQNHLTITGQFRTGLAVALAADGVNRGAFVEVADAGDLMPGDDIVIGWTITPEFVEEHHMTGTWKSFNGKWRPIFQRTVMAVDRTRRPNRIALDVPLRYPAKVRDGASLCKVSGTISECGIESIGIANAVDWQSAWRRAGIHAIGLDGVKDCWVTDVASFVAPGAEADGYHLQGGGVYVGRSKRVTIAGCRMERAQNRGGGGAGYLFEVSRSGEVLTRDCVAVAGRHNFIQNWDFGATGLVWLRCVSRDGHGYNDIRDTRGYAGLCEYHHSLAMACLVDSCVLDDGWFGGNRHDWSSGAGNTVTQSVYWNTSGKGVLRSWQAGLGYVIGTKDIKVEAGMESRYAEGTTPADIVEGEGRADTLEPQSLYEAQLERRLAARAPSRRGPDGAP